jgi:hypothetical protein
MVWPAVVAALQQQHFLWVDGWKLATPAAAGTQQSLGSAAYNPAGEVPTSSASQIEGGPTPTPHAHKTARYLRQPPDTAGSPIIHLQAHHDVMRLPQMLHLLNLAQHLALHCPTQAHRVSPVPIHHLAYAMPTKHTRANSHTTRHTPALMKRTALLRGASSNQGT